LIFECQCLIEKGPPWRWLTASALFVSPEFAQLPMILGLWFLRKKDGTERSDAWNDVDLGVVSKAAGEFDL